MLPLELALGEPQYGCQLLKSPRTILGRFFGEKVVLEVVCVKLFVGRDVCGY